MTAAISSALPVLILHTGDPDDTLKSQFGGYAEPVSYTHLTLPTKA